MKKGTRFLIGLLILLSLTCTKAPDEHSSIIFFIGDVQKNNVIAEIGDTISETDIIKTGKHSSCDIRIGSSIVRVKEKSRMLFSQLMKKNNLENTSLDLEMGKILCKTKKLMKSESSIVKTPTAVAGVRGTKFIVEADKKKTSRVKVYEGGVKVVKRIKQFENKIEDLIEKAPTVKEEEKIVITVKDVVKTEKKVEKLLDKEKKNLQDIDAAMVVVIEAVKDDVIINRKDITQFKIEDFQDENKEIIAVQEKPKEVIKEIKKIVKLEKEKPKPEGRLLVTRFEIFFIKNGRVVWQGKVIQPPIKLNDKIYIAAKDRVFCASLDGPVIWKKDIENNGDLEIREDKLIVSSKGEIKKLDLENGEL